MPTDEAAGYAAALHHVWAHPGRRRAATVPGFVDERDEPPAGSTEGFIRGWRQGIEWARR